jgi:hypothetical protein
MPDLLLRIIIETVAIIDTFLGYIVVSGNLTDPKGVDIANSLTLIMEKLAEVLAQFTAALTNSNVT